MSKRKIGLLFAFAATAAAGLAAGYYARQVADTYEDATRESDRGPL